MNVSLASILRKPSPANAPEPTDLDIIPIVPLPGVLSGTPIIRVDGSYSYVDGSLPWCDIFALLSVLVDRSPQSVLEIGTFNGHTTRLMALNLPDASLANRRHWSGTMLTERTRA